MDQLTKEVLKFKEKGEGKSQLWETISIIIYQFPKKALNWDEELCCDFYLSFHSRIDNVINHFDYNGSSFMTYLNMTLKWHSRSFLQKMAKEARMESLLEREVQIVYDYEIPRTGPKDEEVKKITVASEKMGISFKSGALFYYLMNCSNLSDTAIKRLAVYFGMTEAVFFEFIAALRDRFADRTFRYNRLIQRKNEIYFSLIKKEYEYFEENDPEKKNQLKGKIEIIRRRLDNIREDLQSYPNQPTHRDIAEVLGLSRGTISSSLYKLRKKLNNYTS